MKKIIIVAETGSDVTKELAAKYDIELVPMHVTFGDKTVDDATFPAERIPEYYHETGTLPKTSGCNPGDFVTLFERLDKEHPEAQILYLAYSAITTCSYQSAQIASVDRTNLVSIDTRQVSVGQGAVVIAVAKHLQENPDISMDDLVAYAHQMIERARMCFIPDNLEFLKAGGRVSNVAYMGAMLLNLHPTIEILEGKLVATKKYRGKMSRVCAKLLKEYTEQYNIDTNSPVYFVYTVGLSDEVKSAVKDAASELGYKDMEWIQAHGVITTHGGPAAFGFAGFTK
ncbi:MAG: DegV family EDD domain-containing protein [Erysipelotrichaceae bacterium]|nr:DegV family EDD domain-containing protein [Erysipelotrichaceae bacterium]